MRIHYYVLFETQQAESNLHLIVLVLEKVLVHTTVIFFSKKLRLNRSNCTLV